MREDALLAADHEHRVELEALRVVERHQRHQALVRRAGRPAPRRSEIWARNSSSGRSSDSPSELAVGVELARDADQLLEVLDPALGLDRALGLERLDVAALVEHRLEQLGDRPPRSARSRSAAIVSAKRSTAFSAAAPSAGTAPGSANTSSTSAPIVFACESTRPWVCSPMPRRGELTIRANETASAGLASSYR